MRNSAWTNLSGEHEPLKNGHPCKTLTSVSTMSVFTMLMSTMGGRGCVAAGEEKDGTEECYHGDGRTNEQVNIYILFFNVFCTILYLYLC